MTEKEILEAELKELQKQVREMQKRIMEIEKELLPRTTQKYLPPEILQEAEKVSIWKVILITDWSERVQTAILNSSKIETLRDLYELSIRDPELKSIRSIGKVSLLEIRETIENMAEIISKIQEMDKKVEEFNQPLKFLLSKNLVKLLARNYGIRTVKELYESKNRFYYINLRKKAKEIFETY